VRWALHATLLALAVLLGAAITWADYSRIVPELRIAPGILSAIFWITIAIHAAVTTLLVKSGKNVVASHVIGAVTSPAVAWLGAVVVFAVYKGSIRPG
jgi:hypothetical protein